MESFIDSTFKFSDEETGIELEISKLMSEQETKAKSCEELDLIIAVLFSDQAKAKCEKLNKESEICEISDADLKIIKLILELETRYYDKTEIDISN